VTAFGFFTKGEKPAPSVTGRDEPISPTESKTPFPPALMKQKALTIGKLKSERPSFFAKATG